MRRAAWSLVFLALGASACSAPRAEKDGQLPSLAVVSFLDPPSIQALPGYRAEMVNAPGFSGQAYVMEVGPAQAPAIILVHGLGDNGSRDFHPILPALAARYHVLTFDLPGFGRSTHGHDLYSPAAYADFIRALVTRRISRPFNLVGHSMGGAIALAYAGRFPSDVEKLFLIDAAGVLHRQAYASFMIATGLDKLPGVIAVPGKDLAANAMDLSSQATVPMLPMFPASLDASLFLRTDLLRAQVLKTPGRIAALATIVEDFGPAIAGVTAPTWILWGGKDGVAAMRAAKVLKARLPYAELKVLEGVGHDPMSEAPAAVGDYLLHGMEAPMRPAWQRKPMEWPVLPERTGRCKDQQDARFSGDYSEIFIEGCTATLVDARARRIVIQNSQVVMETIVVASPGIAVEVKDSRVEVTVAEFRGETALRTDGSTLDLAGVELHGKNASMTVGTWSRLVVSVSHVDSAVARRFVHDAVDVQAGDQW